MASLDWVREHGELTVHVKEDGDAIVIRACGELDLDSAQTLEEELRRAMSSEASAVVLDLGSLRFIDSTGLRALLVAAKLSQRNGRRLRMLRAPSALHRLLDITGLERSLPLAD